MKHVIIGDGVAGMSAAQVIRSQRPSDQIILVSSDPQPFYYRAALTNYLMGEMSQEELWAAPPNIWSQLQLKRICQSVQRVQPKQNTVQLNDGTRIEYDNLLIASGARARRLKTPEMDQQRGVKGADHEGIFSIRTLADINRMMERLASAKQVVSG